MALISHKNVRSQVQKNRLTGLSSSQSKFIHKLHNAIFIRSRCSAQDRFKLKLFNIASTLHTWLMFLIRPDTTRWNHTKRPDTPVKIWSNASEIKSKLSRKVNMKLESCTGWLLFGWFLERIILFHLFSFFGKIMQPGGWVDGWTAASENWLQKIANRGLVSSYHFFL